MVRGGGAVRGNAEEAYRDEEGTGGEGQATGGEVGII
jgi:hypothetical protein